MRLWSIHPKYLDSKRLIALWREGLLAKKVLQGKTKGYKHHPQLIRFINFENSLLAIESYLFNVYIEAKKRGYNFNKNKLVLIEPYYNIIPVTSGQVIFEISHLCNKLKRSKLEVYNLLAKINNKEKIELNPIFYLIKGEIEPWEKINF
jgi:hypothetical protein